jgi:hypothetical protein
MGNSFETFATNGQTVELFAYLRQALGVQILYQAKTDNNGFTEMLSPIPCVVFQEQQRRTLTLESNTLLEDTDSWC